MTAHHIEIVGPDRNGEFHVHGSACADLGKSKYKDLRRGWTAAVVNHRDVVEEIYADFIDPEVDGDWEQYDEAINVYPCVKY
jgi:hypothetical protein